MPTIATSEMPGYNIRRGDEDESAAGKLSIISTNNLQDIESALVAEDGSMSGQNNSSGFYKAMEGQSQSYKVHSNNSPDDDCSSGSPSKIKQLGKRLKWVLVKEGGADENDQSQLKVKRGGLKQLLESLKYGKSEENSLVLAQSEVDCPQTTPQIKNHTATLYKKKLYIFGGYDGKKNHCMLRVFDTERNCWLK